MKFRMNEETRKKIWMYTIVLAIGITIYFAFNKIDWIIRAIQRICSLITPFILGFAIAFLLNKPMMLIETKVFARFHIKPQMKRSLSAVSALILGIVAVGLFLAILLPQLFTSVFSLVKAFPGYMEDFQKFALDLAKTYAIDTEQVTEYIANTNFFSKVTEFVTDALPEMARATYAFGNTLLNLILSIMAGLYMLIDKERLSNYVKKINYALFPTEVSEYLHRMALASGDIFNNFIVGKAIDSLIIGILCYIGSLIFQFPYALLLSVIVGVTNMIPVFGPFIGAIPGIVILFIIHPITALYFALFVLALQQFDGNILGPLILGDKLGLPSIGILFSVCVGGGLFGVIGMFIGVPCFAVIYMAVKEFVNYRLEKKNIDLDAVTKEMSKEAMEIEERLEHGES